MELPDQYQELLTHPLFAYVLRAVNDVDGRRRGSYMPGQSTIANLIQNPLRDFLLQYLHFLQVSRLHIHRVTETTSDYTERTTELLRHTMHTIQRGGKEGSSADKKSQ